MSLSIQAWGLQLNLLLEAPFSLGVNRAAQTCTILSHGMQYSSRSIDVLTWHNMSICCANGCSRICSLHMTQQCEVVFLLTYLIYLPREAPEAVMVAPLEAVMEEVREEVMEVAREEDMEVREIMEGVKDTINTSCRIRYSYTFRCYISLLLPKYQRGMHSRILRGFRAGYCNETQD